MTTDFAAVEKLANAVMYEGYALYPYRASTAKNRIRFQWGVLVPPTFAELDPSERSTARTECIVERTADATLRLRVRFLHLVERRLEAQWADGSWHVVETLDLGPRLLQTWDEAEEVEEDLELDVDSVARRPTELTWRRDAEWSEEIVDTVDGVRGRIRLLRRAIEAEIGVELEEIESPYGIRRLRVEIRNVTRPTGAVEGRDAALRSSLVGCHVLLGLTRGAFISMMDPPEWARGYTERCENVGTYPVLVGEPGKADMMLSAPIILSDHPEIAPESPGDLFDATEIDEILTLRTMTMTEDEKRAARGTDPRVAAIVDHADHIPPEMLERLHGAIRQLAPQSLVTGAPPPAPVTRPDTPWWDPGADASVSPETDEVDVDGVAISRGSLVRLSPNLHRADAQDMFLNGRVGVVEAVLHDVDGATHIAVSLEDDPAADLVRVHGRFLYFGVDEVVPMEPRS